MTANNSTPAEGFRHGILYNVLASNGETTALLPSITTCAAWLLHNGYDYDIRAEHLRGELVWIAGERKKREKPDAAALIKGMEHRIELLHRAGIRRPTGAEAEQINAMQRHAQP